MFAVKYIMSTMTRAAEASGSTTGVPNVGAAGKVKGLSTAPEIWVLVSDFFFIYFEQYVCLFFSERKPRNNIVY